MPQPDAVLVGHMLAAAQRITDLVGKTSRETFDQDWVVQDAIIRELEILGEAAGRMSAPFSRTHTDIPWREITGMRHKLIHDYFFVDLDIVWRTATTNVLEVLPHLRSAATELGVADASSETRGGET